MFQRERESKKGRYAAGIYIGRKDKGCNKKPEKSTFCGVGLRNEVGRSRSEAHLAGFIRVGRFASMVSWRTAANVAHQASQMRWTASRKLAAFHGCGSIRVAPMVSD